MTKRRMRILIPTGHLGTVPFKLESFHRGMETRADVVVADAGSTDPGPVFLGAGIPLGLFERDDLEHMLVASRKQGIPMLVGSAGDSVAKLYGISPERISHFVEFDVINAIKFTIFRISPNGSPGESDILGCQQYGPLMDIEVPWD